MPIPTERLYIGAAGEHYVMSECYRHNMEAFKLPIDKGFDLVLTRAYSHFAKAENPNHALAGQPDTPIYLQVKSRSLTGEPTAQKNNRPHWRLDFPIKSADMELLCATPNSALACVLFIEADGKYLKGRTTFAWWMMSDHLNKLKRDGYFIQRDNDPSQLALNIEYVEPEKEPEQEKDQNLYITLLRRSKNLQASTGKFVSGDYGIPDPRFFDFGKIGA